MRPGFIQSGDWRRLGLQALRLTLHHSGELLMRTGQLERQCGRLLQQLGTRLSKPEQEKAA
jgi:hypothetical protein